MGGIRHRKRPLKLCRAITFHRWQAKKILINKLNKSYYNMLKLLANPLHTMIIEASQNYFSFGKSKAKQP
jgi:hypothetical protein